MTKKLIEITLEKELSENSVIIFRNKKWIAIDKSVFLDEVNRQNVNLNNKIDDEKSERTEEINLLKEEIKSLKKTIAYILGEDEDEEK